MVRADGARRAWLAAGGSGTFATVNGATRANAGAPDRRIHVPAVPPVLLLLLAATAPADPAPADLETLLAWMTGSFRSEAQAADDDRYLDIRLEMCPVWTDREDGRWLYVEQAMASSPDRPYRQRVYRVSGADGAYTSEVFELPEPGRFLGACGDPAALSVIAPDSLLLRTGCTVHLRRGEDGRFRGGTDGSGCESTLRGAAYATSVVTVGPEGIDSWDRGFDADGEQVWGAEAGPYRFRRADAAGMAPPTPTGE